MGAKRNRRKQTVIAVSLSIIILLSFAGVTAARYMMEKNQSGIMAAQEFYFTSDLLKEENEKAEYYIDPQKGTFTVNLYNYADSIRTTPENIKYQITVSGGTAAADSGAGTLAGNVQSEAVITVSSTGDTVTVTAISEAPYNKTLTATFIKGQGNQYEIKDEKDSLAAVLVLTCADSEKDIKITLPDGVIPDAANDQAKAYKGNICTYHSQGQGVYSLVLLKTDSSITLSGSGSFADSLEISRN